MLGTTAIYCYRTDVVAGILHVASTSINYFSKTRAREDQSKSDFFHQSLLRVFHILQQLLHIMNSSNIHIKNNPPYHPISARKNVLSVAKK